MKKIKYISALLLIGVMLFSMTACSCNHRWLEATCENPKTCEKCGVTEGNTLPHTVKAINDYRIECEKCGEANVDSAEYTYYYVTVCSNYVNYSYQYDYQYGQGVGVQLTGYDWTVSPDKQEYPGEVEGVESPMFTDYFSYAAMEAIKNTKAYIAYAEKNGTKLSDEESAKVKERVEAVKEQAKGENKDVNTYLQEYYGEDITIEIYELICRKEYLRERVQSTKLEELGKSYTDEELEEYYLKNIDTLGEVDYRMYVLTGEKESAEAFIGELSDGESFKTTASIYENLAGNDNYEDFVTDDSKTLVEGMTKESSTQQDEGFIEWAFSEDTAEGDTYYHSYSEGQYAIYMMVKPIHKPADTIASYDVRHILLQFPEDESEAETEVTLLDPKDYKGVTVDIDVDLDTTGDLALYKQAQDILETYLAGDRTEDAFAELAKEHSEDGNASRGGIYEEVSLGDMVSEFENWAIEDGREKGDVGIVETKFGYHIMYFIGTEITTWKDTARERLATEDYEVFFKESIEGAEVDISALTEEKCKQAQDFVLAFASKIAEKANEETTTGEN